MQAYKRDEMISVTDLLKGFKMTLEKLTTHQLDKVAIMKNNKHFLTKKCPKKV